MFYFLTQVSSGSLVFSYVVGGATQYYYVPSGTQDALFGNGVVMKVTITWDGHVSKLYLNDVQVQSANYTTVTPNWSAASIFNLGAMRQAPYGGYNAEDDIIDEFTVTGPAINFDTTPPIVVFSTPTTGSTVTGPVSLTAGATDNTAMAGVQFKLDGTNLGAMVTGNGPSLHSGLGQHYGH